MQLVAGCVGRGRLHLVLARGSWPIKVHNVKFHSVSRLAVAVAVAVAVTVDVAVAIETAAAILHFAAHFMGSHCVAIANAIVASHCCCCRLLLLLLLLGHIYLSAGHGYGHTFLSHSEIEKEKEGQRES